MSSISDLTAIDTQLKADVGTLVAGYQQAIQTVAVQQQTIAALQANQGQLSADQQAALDAAVTDLQQTDASVKALNLPAAPTT